MHLRWRNANRTFLFVRSLISQSGKDKYTKPYIFRKPTVIRNPLYEDEVKWLIKTNGFDICIHFNVPLFSSLHTILSEEKSFNSGYHVVVDNKI